MSQTSTFLAVFLVLQLACTAATPPRGEDLAPNFPTQWQAAGLSAQDAREILETTLELAVVKRRIGDWPFLADRSRIPVRKDGVAPIPLPNFGEISFIYVSAKELQRLADLRGKPVHYLTIASVRRESGTVIVDIDNLTTPVRGISFGAGITIEFKKTPQGWQSKISREWIF